MKDTDELFREYIRRRALERIGGCERCLSPKFDIQKENGEVLEAWKQLQTAHFISRKNSNLRWDPDNAIGICGGCHTFFHGHPLDIVAFWKKHLGYRKFNLLRGREREYVKREDAALTWRIWLTEQLEHQRSVMAHADGEPGV